MAPFEHDGDAFLRGGFGGGSDSDMMCSKYSTLIKERSSRLGIFTAVLKTHGIKISMDGKSRWRDNVFIDWLWRSLTYEGVCLNAFETGVQAVPAD